MRIYTSFHRFQSGYGRWTAVDDDTFFYSDDPRGYGQTEEEAIEDLLQQLEDE